MNTRHSWGFVLSIISSSWLAACVGELAIDTIEDKTPVEPATYGQAADLVLASDLERWVGERAGWPSFEGRNGMQAGTGPHGVLQMFRLNPVAATRPDTLPNGSIVVCESYATPESTTPEGLTVMQKVGGYDRSHGDWLWARLEANGTIAADENGVPLVGRMGADDPQGCIGCHATAPGGDFVFSNEREE